MRSWDGTSSVYSCLFKSVSTVTTNVLGRFCLNFMCDCCSQYTHNVFWMSKKVSLVLLDCHHSSWNKNSSVIFEKKKSIFLRFFFFFLLSFTWGPMEENISNDTSTNRRQMFSYLFKIFFSMVLIKLCLRIFEILKMEILTFFFFFFFFFFANMGPNKNFLQPNISKLVLTIITKLRWGCLKFWASDFQRFLLSGADSRMASASDSKPQDRGFESRVRQLAQQKKKKKEKKTSRVANGWRQ